MTYAEKLKHPKWQKRRLQVLEYADWRCQLCGSRDVTLHCHHSYYLKGKDPWEYPKGAIISLCEVCHKKQHPDAPEPAPGSLPHQRRVSREEGSKRFEEMKRLLENR